MCNRRKQTVNAAPLTPTWLPMTSTISVLGLLHFSLRTMAGETTVVLNLDCISGRSLTAVGGSILFFELIWYWNRGGKNKSSVLTQMTVPLYVVPQCTGRGKQCFWRPAWRPPYTLHSLYMWTLVLPHRSLTLSPRQATSLSPSMGQSLPLTQKIRSSIKLLICG